MKRTAIALMTVFLAGVAAGQIPHTISYQGYYTSGGQPVTGTYPMAFKLYTVASGGSALWTQSVGSVPITKGVYSVILDVSAVQFDKQLWLETVINGVTSANRTQLTGVPYALAPWNPKDTNVTFTGGNVGVGTTAPVTTMDVRGNLTLDPGTSPVLFTGTASSELNRYLNLINSPTSPSASGLKAGGLLVSDSYSYGNPGKNDLVVKGRIGIGTPTPDQKLTAVGLSTASGGSGSFVSLKSWCPIVCLGGVTNELKAGADDGGGILSSSSDLDIRTGLSGTSRMTLTLGGNVGIGTTTPSYKFEVAGGPLNLVSNGPPDIYGDGLRFGSVDASYKWIQSYHSGPLVLNPLGNNVGIGTTTPGTALEVVGRTRTGSVEITGGSDVAEPFETMECDDIEPGTVMVIDADHPGKLRVSEQPYDYKVAGIVSGAGGVNTGLTLRQRGVMEGNSLIAVVGRVYCKAEALSGAIEPGDLLTTSAVSGHAMKASDLQRSHGAIIGKAMTSLKSGEGLVLVLVNLQ